MVQSKEINFDGQNIYIGIDVHLKTWNVTILTQSGYRKKHSQKSSAKELFEHLKKHYPTPVRDNREPYTIMMLRVRLLPTPSGVSYERI